MKNTKLVWRLGNRPTVEDVNELMASAIITKEEARQILFNSETEEDRDKKSLESEIKFLRDLVEKLSQSRSQIITTIKEVEVPYRKYPWYPLYETWCVNTEGSGTMRYRTTCGTSTLTADAISFSDIKTF